MKTPIRNTF